MMLHVPAVRNEAVVPETMQTAVLLEAKLTARLEVAEADSISGVPNVCVAMALNVMVCE